MMRANPFRWIASCALVIILGALWPSQALSASWDTAQMLNSSGAKAFVPSIAMNSGRNAIAVWEQDTNSDGKDDMMARRYDPATGWGGGGNAGHRRGRRVRKRSGDRFSRKFNSGLAPG